MDVSPPPTRTAAENILGRLKSAGVDYLLANAGTDFPPIIEAYGRLGETSPTLPTPLVVTHESVAMGMAHGYYLTAGKPLAVMVHVNVGLANCVMGLVNAATENIPIVLLSGRTPLTETGRPGSRTTPIHWNQEMYDQHALVRESVKWDYELRHPDQSRQLVERAMSIAMSEPKGPVYLSLPREPLAGTTAIGADSDQAIAPARAGPPAPEAVAAAADLLATAERPLIIATRPPLHNDFGPLPAFAGQIACPVVESWASRNAMPTDHPMHAGYDPTPWLSEADVVLVLESSVPWVRGAVTLPDGCKVIGLGIDPLHSRIPVRGFPIDVNLAGDPAAAIAALGHALAKSGRPASEMVAVRRRRIVERHDAMAAARRKTVAAGRISPMTPQFASSVIADAVGGDTRIFTELGFQAAATETREAGRIYGNPLSGGLGWALPAALGALLAERDSLAVAVCGDGSYIFANPVACHQAAAMHELPVLAIVFNNGVWNAVRRATLGMYPDSAAAKANVIPLTSLGPRPDYAAVARAHGAHAERIDNPDDLAPALKRAIDVIRNERRQAFLDVTVAYLPGST